MLRYPFWGLVLALAIPMGCGGGGTTTPGTTGDLLDASTSERAAQAAGEVAAVESASSTGGFEPLIAEAQEGFNLGDWDACQQLVGNFREGGTLTFADCPSAQGVVSGTITWSGVSAGADEDTTISSTTIDLTYDSSQYAPVQVVGSALWTRTFTPGAGVITREADNTITSGSFRLEVVSDLTWTREKRGATATNNFGPLGRLNSTWPVGTATAEFYRDDVLVRTALVEFDGTNVVVITVGEDVYTFELDGHGARPHLFRPGL